MSFKYNEFKDKLAKGLIDLEDDDFRALLVMDLSTADVDDDAEFVASITTLDEYDGTGYARKILANESVNKDFANDRVLWDWDTLTWSSLGPGTSQCKGMVIFKLVNNDSDSPVICYIDDPQIFPFVGNNNDIQIGPGPDGAMEIV